MARLVQYLLLIGFAFVRLETGVGAHHKLLSISRAI